MIRLGLLLAGATLIVDQVSKTWLIGYLASRGFEPVAVTPFFNLVMVWNPGVSFGLFASDSNAGRWLLTALSLAVCAGLIVWLRRVDSTWLAAALGLVIGGALGNVVDRIFRGKVADFFDFYIAGLAHWPAFNIADSAIVVGVGVLLADSLFGGRGSNK